MNRTLLCFIILLILLTPLRIFASNGTDSESFFVTVEGKLILTGHEPFTNLNIKVNQDSYYSLSGEYLEELKNLTNTVVRITGIAKRPGPPHTIGKIEVLDYSLIQPKGNIRSSWIFGKMYKSSVGYILIDQDQTIYTLVNAEDLGLDRYTGSKILLFGNTNLYNQFYGEMKVEGYNLIKEKIE